LSLAARYVDKTFNFFDEKALNTQPASKIQDWLEDEIEKRFQAQPQPPSTDT
jgi:hypothetical protein